ncbi:MAG TPA: alpha/beta hydrolase [Ramlibacter sp.]|nr:alpha/beta hydrolase [Ramlibacter sp.]
MPSDRINGVELYWELHGERGEPAVLVHGSWGDHHNWDAVVPDLARSLRVATYDRRGHSRSERPASQGSIDEDVEDLAGLIQRVFGGPAHVVGGSFGAAIALRLAVAHPELIRSLVAHEPPLFGLLDDDPTLQPALAEVRDRIDAVLALVRAGNNAGGARRFVETIAYGLGAWETIPQETRDAFVFNAPTWLDEMQEPEALSMQLDLLSNFSAPTLLTLGGASPPFCPLVVKRVAAAIPYARQHVYPDAGHVPHLSHPQEYVQVVSGFIATAIAASEA